MVNCPHPFFPVGLSCAYTQARPDGTGPWSVGHWICPRPDALLAVAALVPWLNSG